MERRGSIKSWNDDKGFGFVSPEGGGPPVFVHISAMRGDRRPQAGDAVFYLAGKDEQGRLRATHMRLHSLSVDTPAIRSKPRTAPAKAATPQTPRRQPSNLAMPQQLGVKLLAFALLCTAPLLGGLQLLLNAHWFWALALYPAVSLLTLVFYGHDKRRAMQGGARTPENTLHLLELLGGWPGALLAQQVYRHKTRKLTYQLVFWLIVLAHQVLWLDWLLLNGQYLGRVVHRLVAI